MRRALAVGLLFTSLSMAIPRDGGWLDHIRVFIHRAIHYVVTTGDGIVPPKP